MSGWTQYFAANARSQPDIPWELGAELTPDEVAAIARSVQEFQVGEGSEGANLYRYAHAYAEQTGDRDYLEAMRWFIAEEQRHSRDLGRFLKLNGIPLVKTTFTDRAFRRLRNLLGGRGGLEVSVSVLVTAEIVSKVYYTALREATQSTILQRLCEQLLRDEVQHIRFQTQQLRRLRAHRNGVGRALTAIAHRLLYAGTVGVVWRVHARALRRGGYSGAAWWQSCWGEFARSGITG